MIKKIIKNNNKYKKILITGGSGFLGSHLADELSSSGFKVYILDNKQSSYLKKNQTMVLCDLLNRKKIDQIVQKVDVIYHFSAISDISEANKDYVKTVEQNILSTVYLLEACVKYKIQRFIFASSIYVYSDYGGIYRTSKQSCELIIENYAKLKNLKFTILRFGSLYGRRSNNNNFIYNLINQAIKKKNIIRNGSGDEIRNYIHVIDAAKCCKIILNSKYENSYQILTGSQTTKIKDLMKMVREIFNKKIKITYKKKTNEEHYEITPYSYSPKFANKLSNEDQIDFGQGLIDLAEYISSNNED